VGEVLRRDPHLRVALGAHGALAQPALVAAPPENAERRLHAQETHLHTPQEMKTISLFTITVPLKRFLLFGKITTATPPASISAKPTPSQVAGAASTAQAPIAARVFHELRSINIQYTAPSQNPRG